MKRYFFITPKEMNFQPVYDCPVPDFIDLQDIHFDQDQMMQDALDDLTELNEFVADDKLGQTLALDLNNNSRKFFRLKDYKEKVPLAS